MGNNNAKIYRKGEENAINLVAKILKTKNFERNKGVFDWLRGDTGMKLRVDAYFPTKNLVLEYHGAQHFRENKLMDRRKGRAKQRRKYTKLRQKFIPMHGLKLLEVSYDEPLTTEHIKNRLMQLGCKI
ncbi:MAG: hypothetical protein WCX71_02510 [Candidatus Buchananbacteria bacterium]